MTRSKKKFIGIAILVIILIILGLTRVLNKKDNQIINPNPDQPTVVKSVVLGIFDQNENTIKVSGLVRPETQVDVVALTNGTLRNILFKVGDPVVKNQTLAQIHDAITLTNFNTARSSYNNLQQNYLATQNTTDQSVKQAKIGLQSAAEQVTRAEINLKAAQDNYNNTQAIIKSNNQDIKKNAIISFYDYLGTVNNTLEQTNYILGVDGPVRLPGLQATLGILNQPALDNTQEAYKVAKNDYYNLNQLTPSAQNITSATTQIINLTTHTRDLVNSTINVLNNTLPSSSFPQSSLDAQKTNFNALRTIITGTLTQAQNTVNQLENLNLNDKQQLDSLDNAVKSAQNQLELAKVSYQNTETTLTSTQQIQKQQLIGAQTSLDNVLGQLNLSSSQVTDLTIKAPISGQITAKYVEVGTEVGPGQKIAQIAQNDLVKIEVDLSSEDIYRIQLGQPVIINETLKGTLANINPSADPLTKKVRVEIIFDNSNRDLIPETFVKISLPIQATSQNPGNNPQAIKIPLKAVTISQTEKYVFVNQNSIAKKVNIEIGDIEGENVVVLNGLSLEDELIVDGAKNLKDGQPIKNSDSGN